MKCPKCNFEISEIDSICPFCNTDFKPNSNIESNDNEELICTPTENNFDLKPEESETISNDKIIEEDTLTIDKNLIMQSHEATDETPEIDHILKTEAPSSPLTDDSVISSPPNESLKSPQIETTSSAEKQNVSVVEKILMFLSKEKKPLSPATQKDGFRLFCIISSLPLMFWFPFVLSKKTKSLLFFANQSLKLTLFMLLNSILLFIFELIPFYKTVSYVKNGILFYSSVKYVPLVIIILITFLILLWLFLTILNIYCAYKGKTYSFLPSKHFNIIR